MTKYYFIGFVGKNDHGDVVYKNATVALINTSITELEKEIQLVAKLTAPPIIISMKDLTKEEYEMLTGGFTQ